MIRKGRKTRKPIWKAVFSSDVMKAGRRIEKGTASGLWKRSTPAMLEKVKRSVSRVCRIMKRCSTVPERETASSIEIWPAP